MTFKFSDFLKPVEAPREPLLEYRCRAGHLMRIPFAGKSVNCKALIQDSREWGGVSYICPEDAYLDGKIPEVASETETEEPRYSGVGMDGLPVPANEAARKLRRAEQELPKPRARRRRV